MDERAMLLATERLRGFFDEVASLSGDQVQRLRQVPRARTTNHLAFDLHPDRLDAVSAGRWTRGHDLLAAEAHRRARAAARHLTPLGRRGVLAKVLENAALGAITDSHPDTVLSPALRTRLVAPWVEVMGSFPGGRRLVAA